MSELSEHGPLGPETQLRPLHGTGVLCGAFPRDHSHYLGRRTRLPLCPPGIQTRTQSYKIFTELRHALPTPDKWAARHNAWFSEATWILVNKTVCVRQEPGRDQARIRKLGRPTRTAMKEDRSRRAERVGENLEQLLTRDPLPPLIILGGGYGDGSEWMWTIPCRPYESHSSGSWRSVWNSTTLQPSPGRENPNICDASQH